MGKLKDYAVRERFCHIFVYADDTALGFFKKQHYEYVKSKKS